MNTLTIKISQAVTGIITTFSMNCFLNVIAYDFIIVHIRLNNTVLTWLLIYYTLLLNHVLQRQCVNETNAPIYLNMHQFCAFKLRSNCALTGEQQVYRSFNVWMKLLGCTLQGRRCVCVTNEQTPFRRYVLSTLPSSCFSFRM